MSRTVLTHTYKSIPICEKEIFRYLGYKTVPDYAKSLLYECLSEIENHLSYKVCYLELPIKIKDNVCDFELFCVSSKDLANNLKNCKKAVLFAATIGMEIDRYIAKYGKISPTKALMFEALGSERIESLCDKFCQDIKHNSGVNLKPRFSPGYGDLPLDIQQNIFSVLDCNRKIGLTLNGSLIMSPSKSVTAFTGISENDTGADFSKCSLCNKTNCEFRGNV
ncbi:MAG: Vitamin B12 dependent methionine synthase activation subunit [Clostridia bacterium]|nr:Vitamin B12 dependent methionine synthase activation subunit [Clostridia bacterium]